jgi:hypothetical protein
VFGVRSAITGACPGSISGTLSSGNIVGVVTLAGFVRGMYLRDRVTQSQTAPTGPDHAPQPEQELAPAGV